VKQESELAADQFETPHTTRARFGRESAFTLVELLIVVAIIGILTAIAAPRFQAVRQIAVERAVASTLRTMATNQQLFYPNPVPLRPMSLTDRTPRFGRLHELNRFSGNVFGRVVSNRYVDADRVRYAMVPLNPTAASLRGRFVIQATERGVKRGFIYQVDESGRIVKIR
jgi:prepilin-type N-terminal cleavage/methylation domain-containing protein